MKFLESFLENDLVGNSSILIITITIFFIFVAICSFYFDFMKNKDNSNKISMLERAIKDLIEEFRSLELNLNEQKKILNDYKYTLDKLDLEISRLADSNKGDSKITTAIQMANQGRSLDEISKTTGLTNEEVEPILKYHGKA
tara:strand:- start:178 stop:603 length:426 start_codon:yes stop_codon:yes gene_type:complete